MNKKNEEQFDFKEWEERMRKEGYDVPIPKSLEPDEVAKKLRHVKQDGKRSAIPWKPVSIAASFVLVAGISIFAITNSGAISYSKEENSLTESMEEKEEFSAVENDAYNMEDSESVANKEEKPVAQDKGNLAETSMDEIGKNESLEDIEISGLVKNWMTKEDQKIIAEDDTYVYAAWEELDENGQNVSSITVYKKDSSFSKFVDKVAISNGFLAKAVYINEGMLSVVAAKPQEKTSMVIFYKVDDSGCLSKVGENSLEGNLSYSMVQDGYLYAFMDSGKFGTFDAKNPSNFSSTREIGDIHTGYYMNGNNLYVFKGMDDGKTMITSYILTPQILEKGKEQIIDENTKAMLAVNKDEDGLKIFVGNMGKDNGAVTLYILNEDMNVISRVQNIQKEQTIVAAEFLGNQLACFGVEETGDEGDERNAYMLALDVGMDGHLRETSLKELDKSKTFRSFGKVMWSSEKENLWKLFYTTQNVNGETFAHAITWGGEDKWLVGNPVLLGESGEKGWSGISDDGNTCYVTDGEGLVKAFTME